MFGFGLKELVVLGVYIYVIFKVLKKGEITKKVIATAVALLRNVAFLAPMLI